MFQIILQYIFTFVISTICPHILHPISSNIILVQTRVRLFHNNIMNEVYLSNRQSYSSQICLLRQELNFLRWHRFYKTISICKNVYSTIYLLSLVENDWRSIVYSRMNNVSWIWENPLKFHIHNLVFNKIIFGT